MSKNWDVTLNLGERIPGRELLSLLEQIGLSGSLNRAASSAGMSYRYAWGLLNRAEDALGKALVTRQAGGILGGGTSLTTEGRQLLVSLQTLQSEVSGQLSALLGQVNAPANLQLLLASTMEPVVTGLLDVLEQAYFNETGVAVRHVAAGSGQALSLARLGRVDLVLTHAPELEERFISDGYGERRIPVMSNDYLIVGPDNDPAGIGDSESAAQAMRRIAANEAPFVSRGDLSGTHLFELGLWEEAGIDPAGQAWYLTCRSVLGSYELLRLATNNHAYTIVDRASFLTGGQTQSLKVLAENDPRLANTFSLICVSRKKAAVNQHEAERFAAWLVSPQAAAIIEDFGSQTYRTALFRPVKYI